MTPAQSRALHELVLGIVLTQAILVPLAVVTYTASASIGALVLAIEAVICFAAAGDALRLRPFTRKVGGIIAFGTLMAGALTTLTVVVLRDRNFQSELTYELRVDPHLCTVRASGYIPSTFYRMLERTLDERPEVRALIVDGPGGSSHRLVDAARLMRDRGVHTAVSLGHCASGCAFLWLAAANRYVVGQPPLFHAPEVFGERQGDIQAEQLDYLIGKVPKPFLDRAWLGHGPESFWAPTIADLSAHGVSATPITRAALLNKSFCEGPAA